MSWQSTPLLALRISGSLAGRSPNATAGASRASRRASASISTATANRRACVQSARCDGATWPTWLETSFSRRLWKAPPSGTGTWASPYQLSLQHGGLEACERERGGKAGRPCRWRERQDRNRLAQCLARRSSRPSFRASSARAGLISTSVTCAPATLPAQKSDQRADHAAANNGDAAGRARLCIPDRVERGLHIGGKHRAHAAARRRATPRRRWPGTSNRV